MLRGHCRDCGAAISYRYPIVELLTAIGFCACVLQFGATLLTLKYCIFCFLLIGLIFTDAETGLLVHELTYTGIVLGLAFAPIVLVDFSGTSLLLAIFHHDLANPHWLSLLDAFVAAAFGAGFFFVAWGMYYLVRKRHGLGFGDIALMAMSGAFLGLKLLLIVLILAPLLTVAYAIVLLVSELVRPRKDVVPDAEPSEDLTQGEPGGTAEEDEPVPLLQREIPFGVFLGACSLFAIFFGEKAWAWYLSKVLPQ
jgi:leader peptidase (prepilin peptidase)/N-methyltransferase